MSIISKPAAYLDPGSGSMLVQLILGAVLGAGVFIRVFWKNIKSFFTKGKSDSEELADPTALAAQATEGHTEVQSDTDLK